jgi:hypothetical protein
MLHPPFLCTFQHLCDSHTEQRTFARDAESTHRSGSQAQSTTEHSNPNRAQIT